MLLALAFLEKVLSALIPGHLPSDYFIVTIMISLQLRFFGCLRISVQLANFALALSEVGRSNFSHQILCVIFYSVLLL